MSIILGAVLLSLVPLIFYLAKFGSTSLSDNFSDWQGFSTYTTGLISPLIGLASASLLYLALRKQIRAQKDQRIKAEMDVIFTLIHQLDNEIDRFQTKHIASNVTSTGWDGLTSFTRSYYYEECFTGMTTNLPSAIISSN